MNIVDNASIQSSPTMDDVKDSVTMKAIFLLNLFINFIGGTMHFTLVYVSVKNRRFHSTCNLLIAANSVCVMLAYLSPIMPLLVFFLPHFRPTLLQCFAVQSVPLLANFHIFSLIMVIGLDRLLSAFWPIWYLSRNDRCYFFPLFFGSALFPVFIERIAFKNMMSKPNVEKACTLGEVIGKSSSFAGLCCLLCIIVSVSFYTAVWARLKLDIRRGQHETVRCRQSIFRSLCIILSLQVCGWTLGQLIYAIVYMNSPLMHPLTRWYINSIVFAFLSLIAAMDVPVLYKTSRDYRDALKQTWPWKFIPKCEEKQKTPPAVNDNTVTQITAQNATVNITTLPNDDALLNSGSTMELAPRINAFKPNLLIRPIVNILSKKKINANLTAFRCPLNESARKLSIDDLLGIIEVAARPFDGLSNVNGILPVPLPIQFCTFEEPKFDDEQCSFYSSESENLQFKIGRFCNKTMPTASLLVKSFANQMKRPIDDLPKDNFLMLIEPFGVMPSNSAILKMDIACQKGDGQLSFNYWCTTEQFVLKQIFNSQNTSRVEVLVVNPSLESFGQFSVEIIAEDFAEPSLMILDNLHYEAEQCPIYDEQENVAQKINELSPENRNKFNKIYANMRPVVDGAVTRHKKPIDTTSEDENAIEKNWAMFGRQRTNLAENFDLLPPIQFRRRNNRQPNLLRKLPNACELLKCTFNDTFCHWSQLEQMPFMKIRTGKWQIAKPQELSFLMETREKIKQFQHSGYAYIGNDQTLHGIVPKKEMMLDNHHRTRRTVYVLQSPEFVLSKNCSNSALIFDLYKRTNAIIMKICLNSMMNCVYEAPYSEVNVYWRIREKIVLPPDTKKIYVIATQWKRISWLAIDNIRLLEDGTECQE
uniref:G_PROTEIN_RECEP_F1_2 domain-containing protein n=1 Tax=Globodera pallida TaxID=36090 RepID=A0A183BZV6_GLOPA